MAHAIERGRLGGQLEPRGEVLAPVRVAEGDARLVEDGQARAARDDEVDVLAGVEQTADHGHGVRRAAHPDTPTTHGRRSATARGCSVMPDIGSRAQALRNQADEREPEQRDADEAVDREERPVDAREVVGPHEAVLVYEGRGGDDEPAEHQPLAPEVTPKATNSAKVTTWTTRAATSARATPKRAGMERTPIARSISASWQA